MLHNTGIIDDPSLSLFTYDQKGSWGTFYKPEYKPLFKAEFSDPELEEKAHEVQLLIIFAICIVYVSTDLW